ncbi:cysteine--tRNA ligase [Gloeocapsopsis dulcis]|uniref:Cysteine--tRNA ligase n=1 Tax=Gloeocapsopsis dulcis AAB1 = 1H9 TaxID=1433147 RepID=A0A6N8FY43_9CHRO|nr:cysteine--tRNA ligase [Gloeocapsopsis dulcis]MUL37881.1 cysteine--tRNA ligase [Gloeocapsopsis dulcis AAB1 = 1H9]WNN92312.1 cysteine--tRNA ligase [Gloeocapsopsis dulcis]
MTLLIYNTLTRRKELFTTIKPSQITMYCCGVTVYDDCHLGHARSYIGWDVVRRYLQWRGYQVRYVQNFTDIDDKILNRAQAEGSSMQAIADRYIAGYFEDIRQLNILDADEYPRVTEHIPAIRHLIQALEEKGYAYAVDGDVYYNVRQFADYGKLSGRQLEQMQAGAGGRLDSDDLECKKQDSCDFALWKAAKLGEPAWESPWGKGRPGWHIECSAMIRARLGETIDIHGGGGDLIFPHHENEIAQSEVLTGQPLANYWLHNGMVTVNGEKMSKSLGNFTTIRDLLEGKWSEYPQPVAPMVIRLFVLQAHYRKPLDFTKAAIAAAEKGWQTLKEALTLDLHPLNLSSQMPISSELDTDSVTRFQAAMDDDFNTAAGLAVLFELAKSIKREFNLRHYQSEKELSDLQLQSSLQTLIQLAQIFGLQAKQENTTVPELDGVWIESLLEQRHQARQEKRYAQSDRIRDELQAVGITLVDQPDGQTRWHCS